MSFQLWLTVSAAKHLDSFTRLMCDLILTCWVHNPVHVGASVSSLSRFFLSLLCSSLRWPSCCWAVTWSWHCWKERGRSRRIQPSPPRCTLLPATDIKTSYGEFNCHKRGFVSGPPEAVDCGWFCSCTVFRVCCLNWLTLKRRHSENSLTWH